MSENRLADEAQYFGALQDGVDSQQELIESLRQRVKELERVNAIHAEANSIIRRDNDTLKAELAALKSQQAAHMLVKTYSGGKPNYCKESDEVK